MKALDVRDRICDSVSSIRPPSQTFHRENDLPIQIAHKLEGLSR